MRRLVVEADGGSRGNPGPAGYGAVVKDAATGEPLSETAGYIGTATNNVAEYRGLIAGLRAARELDAGAEVLVRMDSRLVVEQMSGRWQVKHPGLRPLAAEARSVFPPGQVGYEWVPRERNKHADRLANEAMDAGRHGRRQAGAEEAGLEEAGLEQAGLEQAGPAGVPGGAVAEREVREPAVREPAVREPAVREPAAQAVVRPAAPDLGTPTTLVLLRHAETPLTRQKRFSGCGGEDPALSGTGQQQAERVAAALARRGTVQAIVSSPLLRCRQTADAVAARLGLEVLIDEGLRETDFGAWDGLAFAEVRQRYPADLDAWLASAEAAPTGGESFAEVARRVAACRDRLIARHPGRTVLVVSHATPVKTLVRLALGAPPEALFRMEVAAAALSAVAYYADGNNLVRLLNDTSHLR